jgi:hypothetical protein
MSSGERRYTHIDVIDRRAIDSYAEAARAIRALATSEDDTALSSNVVQTLIRIADGLDKIDQVIAGKTKQGD